MKHLPLYIFLFLCFPVLAGEHLETDSIQFMKTGDFSFDLYSIDSPETINIYSNDLSEAKRIKILNDDEKIVRRMKYQESINIKSLKPGLYFMLIETKDGKQARRKFIKAE